MKKLLIVLFILPFFSGNAQTVDAVIECEFCYAAFLTGGGRDAKWSKNLSGTPELTATGSGSFITTESGTYYGFSGDCDKPECNSIAQFNVTVFEVATFECVISLDGGATFQVDPDCSYANAVCYNDDDIIVGIQNLQPAGTTIQWLPNLESSLTINPEYNGCQGGQSIGFNLETPDGCKKSGSWNIVLDDPANCCLCEPIVTIDNCIIRVDASSAACQEYFAGGEGLVMECSPAQAGSPNFTVNSGITTYDMTNDTGCHNSLWTSRKITQNGDACCDITTPSIQANCVPPLEPVCDCEVNIDTGVNDCEMIIDFVGSDCGSLYSNVNLAYYGNGASPAGSTTFPESFCNLQNITPGVDITVSLSGCPNGDGWYGIQLSGATDPCTVRNFGFAKLTTCTQDPVCDPAPTVTAPSDESVCWTTEGFNSYQLGSDWFINNCSNWSGSVTAPSGCNINISSNGSFFVGQSTCEEYGVFTINLTCNSGDCAGETFSDTWTITNNCVDPSCNCPSFNFPDQTWCSGTGNYDFDPTPFGNYGDCSSASDLWEKNGNLTDLNTIVDIDGPGRYCYVVSCTPTGCSQCRTEHCFDVVTQCNCNSTVTLTSNGCILTASATNCPNATYTFVSPSGQQFPNGSSNTFTATASGNWIVSVRGCEGCNALNAQTTVNCNVNNCSCSDSQTTASFDPSNCRINISDSCPDRTWVVLKWNSSGCTGGGNTNVGSGNGNSTYNVTENGFYQVIFIGTNGCSNLMTTCNEFNCAPTCNCNATLLFDPDECELCWSYQGADCDNFESRRILNPDGSATLISGNSGCTSVSADGTYTLNSRDVSGNSNCPEKNWNANVSGCEGCTGTDSYSPFPLSANCFAAGYGWSWGYNYNCSDDCCGPIEFDGTFEVIANGSLVFSQQYTFTTNCGDTEDIFETINIGNTDPCDISTIRFSGFVTSNCTSNTFDVIRGSQFFNQFCNCPSSLINDANYLMSTNYLPSEIKGTSSFNETFIAQESKNYIFELSSYYRKDQFIINEYDSGCIRTQSGIDNNEPFIYEIELDQGEQVNIQVNECTQLSNSYKILIR